jgi:ureidoacrylate peracid hydrolase
MGKITRRDFVSIGAAGGLIALGSRHARVASPARRISIEARPEPITIDTARTAVLVVDMQNDFGSQGGMFQRAGIDISPIRGAVAPTAKALSAAREAGIRVVYLKMAFQPDLSDAGPPDSPTRRNHRRLNVGKVVLAPNGSESRILIRDTWNTDILPELTPKDEDITLYKHRYSGFFQTDLDSILRKIGVSFLIVTGCTTSVCVESTIRDAMFRDYSCVLLADCTGEPIGSGLARSNHEASLLTIQSLLGWVSTSGEFVRALHPVAQEQRMG